MTNLPPYERRMLRFIAAVSRREGGVEHYALDGTEKRAARRLQDRLLVVFDSGMWRPTAEGETLADALDAEVAT